MRYDLQSCIRSAAKRPDANTRAMGTAVAVSLFAAVGAALLYSILRGGAIIFQSMLIYLPAAAFCVIMFMCPVRGRWFAATPAALWCLCFIFGILIQQGMSAFVKVIGVLVTISIFVCLLGAVSGVKYCRHAMFVLSVTLCVLCAVYGVYDVISAIVEGTADWSEEIAGEGASFVSGLLAKGDKMTLPNIRMTSFVFMIPSAMMFFCLTQNSYLYVLPDKTSETL